MSGERVHPATVLPDGAPPLPLLLLLLAPLVDVASLHAPYPALSLLACCFALIGAAAALVVTLPALIEHLFADEREPMPLTLRRLGLASQLIGLTALSLGVYERLHHGAVRFDAWALLLAVCGAIAWLPVGRVVATSRPASP
jgi:hypothetical protein